MIFQEVRAQARGGTVQVENPDLTQDALRQQPPSHKPSGRAVGFHPQRFPFPQARSEMHIYLAVALALCWA